MRTQGAVLVPMAAVLTKEQQEHMRMFLSGLTKVKPGKVGKYMREWRRNSNVYTTQIS